MKHMLSSALFAGFVAGLIFALLQYLFVEPDILLSERYETGELVHFQGLVAASSRATHDMASASPVLRHALTVHDRRRAR